MDTTRDRVISIILNEHDWQAFVQKHPQPVSWLRDRIQESIGPEAISGRLSAPGAASTTSATTR